jgi:hypothetical protein
MPRPNIEFKAEHESSKFKAQSSKEVSNASSNEQPWTRVLVLGFWTLELLLRFAL